MSSDPARGRLSLKTHCTSSSYTVSSPPLQGGKFRSRRQEGCVNMSEQAPRYVRLSEVGPDATRFEAYFSTAFTACSTPSSECISALVRCSAVSIPAFDVHCVKYLTNFFVVSLAIGQPRTPTLLAATLPPQNGWSDDAGCAGQTTVLQRWKTA